MEKTNKAGAMKSWTCVLMLTFLLPTGAFQLTNTLFAATAQAGQRVTAYLYKPEVAADSPVVACPELARAEIL